jgi:murein L,D-transpeptidase YcbB/YkuD
LRFSQISLRLQSSGGISVSKRISQNLRIGLAGAAISTLLFACLSIGPTEAEAGLLKRLFGGRQGDGEWSLPYNGSHYRDRQRNRSLAQQREVNPPPGEPTLSPANLAATKAAVERYGGIVARGGWPELPRVRMGAGVRGDAVAVLRQRLEITGDLPPSGGRGYSTRYDGELQQAVGRFQSRHGLTATGSVDESTLMALNVPASARLRQLRANLARLRSGVGPAAGRYVIVNIPAAQVEAVENDRVISRHSAVVGKPDRQTPELRSRIHEINFNPYWTVPKSIIIRDLVPKARELARHGKDVLTVYKMEAFDGSGRKLEPTRINWFSDTVYNYTYRQIPWDENSLGFVKINFHNKHAVYMHDTPMQKLFGRNWRAESSGCVRVHGVDDLVAWLLEGNPGWDITRVRLMEQTGGRLDVTLKRSIPVYFVYVTAWATPDGTVHFRRDLYQRDDVDGLASAY